MSERQTGGVSTQRVRGARVTLERNAITTEESGQVVKLGAKTTARAEWPGIPAHAWGGWRDGQEITARAIRRGNSLIFECEMPEELGNG